MLSVAPPARTGDHHPGDVIAERYVLKHLLCEGGMGMVWAAHSKALDVDVAIKLLHGSLADTEGVERMAREAHAVARLGHPAIVRVIDYGLADDAQPFIAMELLDGEELFSLLRDKGRLPPKEAVGLLLPILDALATAHQSGIVHRDIKPENIFIARDDLGRRQPKLVDFGIAKLESDRSTYSRLTLSGALLGTPQYLSPEQAFGDADVDFRTDIWSAGVVLYELITGAHPFSGPNYNALLRSITQDAPLPTTVFGVGDEQLWRVIERCLAKNRDERWESVWALGEALSLWLLERGVEVDASSRSLRDVWLDGGITGLRIIEAPSDPAAPASTAPVELQPTAVPYLRRIGRRVRLRTAAVAGLALSLGLAVSTWALRQPKASSMGSAATAPLASGSSGPHAVLEAPPPIAPPAHATDETRIASPPDPGSRPEAAIAGGQPRSTGSKKSSKPSRARPSASIDAEFGF